MNQPKLGFVPETLTVALSHLIPIRSPVLVEKTVKRYSTILSSLREVGLLEPLVIFPHKASKGKYLIMDGNLRFHALQKLNVTEALCVIAHEDESFTYNAKISRMSPIQEHRMILRAIKNGVPLERLALTLNLSEGYVRDKLNLLQGLHPFAVQILEQHHVSQTAISLFKRVLPERQIEMAEMMVAVNEFNTTYVQALLVATHDDFLIEKRHTKKVFSISEEEEARLRDEMRNLEADFKAVEESYGDNFLKLTTACGYLRTLLENQKVSRWLTQRHREIVEQLKIIACAESL